MPKNLTGGNKHKKGKNKKDRPNEQITIKTKMVYAEDGQIYASAVKREGGTRITVNCTDGKTRSAIIPGKFRNRVWINPGDILLCELETLGTDNICSIVKKYNNHEARELKNKKLINFEVPESEDEENVKFGEDKIEEDYEIPNIEVNNDNDIDDL